MSYIKTVHKPNKMRLTKLFKIAETFFIKRASQNFRAQSNLLLHNLMRVKRGPD